MKLLPLAFGLCLASVSTIMADEPELKSIKARTLELTVPADWRQKAPATQTRAAQLSVPGKDKVADLVVFYFGGPTGGVKANVERWIGQFEKDGLTLKMVQGDCRAGRYILVDTQGTWNKPDGPPFARKTISTANSRVLNVIVIEKMGDKEDYYFLKLSGHEDVVGKHTKALRAAIGADPKSEKAFKLTDTE